MFRALKSGKVRVRDGFEELRLADFIKRNEDFLTAAVFTRLVYLPPDVLAAALLPTYVGTLGQVQEPTFWPTWSVRSASGDTTRVEPDVYLEFENIGLIVEAKLNDEASYHTSAQWAREWAAWHQGEYGGIGKQVFLLGIGGLGSTDKAITASVAALVRGANQILETDFPRIPLIHALGLSWQQLYNWLTSNDPRYASSPQLVQDLREIFHYFGLRSRLYLGDLSRAMQLSKVGQLGVTGPETLRHWKTSTDEADWTVNSKSFRPISPSSINVFGRSL